MAGFVTGRAGVSKQTNLEEAVGANTSQAYDKLAKKAAVYNLDGHSRFEMISRAQRGRQ